MKKKVGFFGGSFDPIHFGHLNLAVQIFEICHLDEILFCPANCSPFKLQNTPKANKRERLQMVEKALEPFPSFHVCTSELQREGPSYTIDTLRSLKKEHVDLYLLLSLDAALDFEKWKKAEEILQIASPRIGARAKRVSLKGAFAKMLRKGLIKIPVMEISSTEIRDRLKKKLPCSHLVPAKVLDYIYQHQLYSSSLIGS